MRLTESREIYRDNGSELAEVGPNEIESKDTLRPGSRQKQRDAIFLPRLHVSYRHAIDGQVVDLLFDKDAVSHGLGGNGLVNSRANIVGAHALADVDGSNFIRVVLQGSSDNMAAPGRTMPAFGAIYNDAEIAALTNFVIGEIGKKKGAVTAEDVAKARE